MGKNVNSFYVKNNLYADVYDLIPVKLPTDEDMAISEMMIKEITNIIKSFKLDELVCSETKDNLKDAPYFVIEPYVTETLNLYNSIGCGKFNKELLEILSKVNYKTFNRSKATAFIYSLLSISQNTVFNNPKFLAISQPFSNLTKFHLCHEFAHLLKERFTAEFYLSFTKFEVIPKALEFITAFKNGNVLDLEDEFKNHILGLNRTCIKHYLSSKDELLNSTCTEFEKRALKCAINRANCYLNSFYYALILFRLYLDEPEYIIELINMVFAGEISTEDMFDYLDKNKFENYASDGLAEIKKYLK